MEIEERINAEIQDADKNYKDFNSTHEVYGVLMEEVEEFWQYVCSKNEFRDEMISELIQISAIAKRAAIQLQNNKIKHV